MKTLLSFSLLVLSAFAVCAQGITFKTNQPTATLTVRAPNIVQANGFDIVTQPGVVGWVLAQQYASVLQTNLPLSDQETIIFQTNNILLSGSNYLGHFPMLLSWFVGIPPSETGPQASLSASTNGEITWFSLPPGGGFSTTNPIDVAVINGV
jgi:hypothetical protein